MLADFIAPYLNPTTQMLAPMLACSVSTAFICWLILPKKYRRPASLVITGFLLFATLIPVLSWLPLMVMALFLRYQKPSIEEESLRQVDVPPAHAPLEFNRMGFNQEAMQAYLYLDNIPMQTRIKALMALTASPSPRSNLILRDMLHNDNDELRLLAFALLDGQEERINEQINTCKERLEKFSHHHDVLHKRLAFLYWELNYLKLTQGDLARYILEQSMKHIELALNTIPEDAALLALKGKIELQQGLNPIQSLQQAANAGAPASKVIPFLAEIKFKAGDIRSVKQLLKGAPYLADVPNLRSIVNFWGRYD